MFAPVRGLSTALNSPSWTVLQIGAREHYGVARSLQQRGELHQLLTDCWVPPSSLLARIPQVRRLTGRYHPLLAQAAVRAPSLRSLAFELRGRLPGTARGWPLIIARNAWFQRWALRHLAGPANQHHALFAYSYAARAVLALARERGLRTVLGQIDPGPEEERLVSSEHRRYTALASCWQPAPPSYWQAWHEELELAERIVVNSPWSLRCLQREGVPDHKLCLIPLVYELDPAHRAAEYPIPAARSGGQFQLLFLGTIGLRKGIGRLLEAMRLLEDQPVQLTMAGPSELDHQAWAGAANIRWLGPVPRCDVGPLYRQAQAMILPTISDGFAITQLEALARGCPVIASQHCGEVVTPGLNGWILPNLEPEAIASTILEAMNTAHKLPQPLQCSSFGIADLGKDLNQLIFPTVAE